MKIENNIIKHYLKNCFFITGTAYAGKSTMCKMLAEKYNLIHCEENYNSDVIFSIVDQEHQPNLNYFNTKKDWQEYLNRDPLEYEAWVEGNGYELAGFEVAELIRLSSKGKVIVDTNIPVELLKEIADEHQIAIMLSSREMAVERFFDREDPEKQFLLRQIENGPSPDETMENFRKSIERISTGKLYRKLVESGLFILRRDDNHEDTKLVTMEALARHFRL